MHRRVSTTFITKIRGTCEHTTHRNRNLSSSIQAMVSAPGNTHREGTTRSEPKPTPSMNDCGYRNPNSVTNGFVGVHFDDAPAASSFLPYAAAGRVVHGFGRGGKQLNCATANLDSEAVSALPAGFPCGVYYGWARVDQGNIWPMVMSVGWNPQFKNTVKTMEAHILHDFATDFYDSQLQLLIIGFIRPMQAFSTLDDLIAAIESDKAIASAAVKTSKAIECYTKMAHEPFMANSKL